jgi:hypothetical protein
VHHTGPYNGAATHHRPACHATTRTDHRGSPHGASASHGDLDDRVILLELILERAVRSGERRRRRNRHSERSQTNYYRAGVESPRCAAALTNQIHDYRLHRQALSVFARCVIDARSEGIGQHLFPI